LDAGDGKAVWEKNTPRSGFRAMSGPANQVTHDKFPQAHFSGRIWGPKFFLVAVKDPKCAQIAVSWTIYGFESSVTHLSLNHSIPMSGVRILELHSCSSISQTTLSKFEHSHYL
jgi:hypothetical protein